MCETGESMTRITLPVCSHATVPIHPHTVENQKKLSLNFGKTIYLCSSIQGLVFQVKNEYEQYMKGVK